MKKSIVRILSIFMLGSMLFGTNVFAARETIYLAQNQVWTNKYGTRTGSYSTVLARLNSVYPPGGALDTYTRAQVRVTNSLGTIPMSDIITLSENNTSNTTIQLRDGTLSNTSIRFQFRGNNPNRAAYADVYYNAR